MIMLQPEYHRRHLENQYPNQAKKHGAMWYVA